MQKQQPAFDQIPDDALVTMAQRGDGTAFGQLVDRYYSPCLKLATSILRNVPDAEDEVQNSCRKAYEHIGQFHRDAKFSTWLTRIVVNQCLMRLRQHRTSRLIYIEDASSESGQNLDLRSQEESPEVAVWKNEVSNVLREEIRRIPPLLRNVYLLRDVQELPLPDVAAKLGISVAAAKSRLLRARVELRHRLHKHEGRQGSAAFLT